MLDVIIEAVPGNNSWYQFRQNWWKIITGGIRFIITNPASCWPVLNARLNFALRKKSITLPIKTPEGFTIENNRELLVYSHIFIEQNMRWNKMLREFKQEFKYPMPLHVLDVGANVGFFTQFLARFRNNQVHFHLFEPLEHLLTRASQINWVVPTLKEKYRKAYMVLNPTGVGRSDEHFKSVNIGSIISPRELDESFVGTAEMPITCLNDYCGYGDTLKIIPIFCLKIDTDGMNHDVLYGAKKILQRVLWVMIEQDAEYDYCAEILHRFGFKHVGNSSPVDAVWYNPNAVINWTHEFRQHKGLPPLSQPDLPNLNLEPKHDGSC